MRTVRRTRGAGQRGDEQRKTGEFLAEPIVQVFAKSTLFASHRIEQCRLELPALRHIVDDPDEQGLSRRVRLADRYFGWKSGSIPASTGRRAGSDEHRPAPLRVIDR